MLLLCKYGRECEACSLIVNQPNYHCIYIYMYNILFVCFFKLPSFLHDLLWPLRILDLCFFFFFLTIKLYLRHFHLGAIHNHSFYLCWNPLVLCWNNKASTVRIQNRGHKGRPQNPLCKLGGGGILHNIMWTRRSFCMISHGPLISSRSNTWNSEPKLTYTLNEAQRRRHCVQKGPAWWLETSHPQPTIEKKFLLLPGRLVVAFELHRIPTLHHQ